jgi:hypothetical protein
MQREPTRRPSEALLDTDGDVLQRADAEWHTFPGEEETLIRFWLTFSRSGTFAFAGAADGQSIRVEAGTLGSSFDMAEFGQIAVRPAASSDPPARSIGQPLIAVEDLLLPSGEVVMGARLIFGTGMLQVANWCDDLYWSTGELPDFVEYAVAD